MPSESRAPRFARRAVLPIVGGASLVATLVLVSMAGCASKKPVFDPNAPGGGDDSGAASDDGGINFNNTNPNNLNLDGSTGTTGNANSMCKGGFYEGQFTGAYSSHLTIIGANIPVTGDVRLTLQQKGSGMQMCTFQGESELCSNIFSVQNGTIDGVADGLFPYHCSLTGTLGCKEKKLVGGWINCTYCLGPLNDGGMSCAIGGSGGGMADGGLTGSGGQFGGPLTSDYFYNSVGGDGGAGAKDGGGKDPAPAFGTAFWALPATPNPDPNTYDPGQWNGSEALAGYSGMGPLPDGGTLNDYISDAGYGRIGVMNDFGGDGYWWATWQHP